MRMGCGETVYEWKQNWARLPESKSQTRARAHHSIVVTYAWTPPQPLELLDVHPRFRRRLETGGA